VATLTGISPVLLVTDLERSVTYYTDRLRFTCTVHGDPPNVATADRDEATILLALADQPDRLVPDWKIVDMMSNAYIRVDYTIYDAPHGFREFGVQDPDGHDITFGQRLGR
jgi:catechol 2,3-dioxygenase-like lactoylglutathione lyase family enzyme